MCTEVGAPLERCSTTQTLNMQHTKIPLPAACSCHAHEPVTELSWPISYDCLSLLQADQGRQVTIPSEQQHCWQKTCSKDHLAGVRLHDVGSCNGTACFCVSCLTEFSVVPRSACALRHCTQEPSWGVIQKHSMQACPQPPLETFSIC